MFHNIKRRLIISCVSLTLLQLCGLIGTAQAQLGPRIQRPFNTPTVSPYLNLFRGSNSRGGNAILNYYGLVRPQQQAMQQNNALRNDLNQFSNQPQMNSRQNRNRRASMLGVTGHATSFMSLGGGGGAGGGGDEGGAGGSGQQGSSGHSANIGGGNNFGNSGGFGGGGYAAGGFGGNSFGGGR